MKIPQWVWKTNFVGGVAMLNLTCTGALLVLQGYLFGINGLHHGREPEWKLIVHYVIVAAEIVLAFPVGWLSMLGQPLHGVKLEPVMFTPALFLPLNAYAWGAMAAWIRHAFHESSN